MFQLGMFAALLIAGAIANPLKVKTEEVRPFEGEKVIKCSIPEEKREMISEMTSAMEMDIFKEFPNGDLDIRVNSFQYQMMMLAGVPCEVLVENLGQVVADASERRSKYTHDANVYFEEYHTYAEQVSYYQSICSQYGNICRRSSIGTSTLGQEMYSYVIETNPANRVFFLDAGIHAREWISSCTLQYIVTQLLETASAPNSLASRYTWVISGHGNPDGYIYSWASDNNRLWRKSRNVNPGSSCIGTDLNRNWPTGTWGGAGSSANPCSDTFHGAGAGSEREVKNVIELFNTWSRSRVVPAAISFHSYSQLILRPWGNTTANPPDETAMRNLGAAMASAIRETSGLTYENIKSIELYATTGTTSDWYYETSPPTPYGQHSYGYTYELRDLGRYGFELPENQIIPQGEEIWAAMIALADFF
jgi:murein tripeptide amidase MpaA